VLNPAIVAIVQVPGYAVIRRHHSRRCRAVSLQPHATTDFLLELEEIPAEVLKQAKLVYLN